MNELIALWKFLQEVGQVSMVGVLVALLVIRWNDLRHLQAALKRVEGLLLDHLTWHAESGTKPRNG